MEQDRHLKELTLLHTISRTVDQSIDMRSVVHPILEALASTLGFRMVMISLLRKDGDELLIEAAHGLTRKQAELGRYKLGEGVTGQVVLTGEPMVIPRTSESQVFLNRTQLGRSDDTSFICVPIKEKQEVVGALSVYRLHAPDAVLEGDVKFLGIVASMLARAVLLRRDVLAEQESLKEENRQLRAELTKRYQPDNLVGNSREMADVYDLIHQVAASPATVLIHGETGTGKELVAHALHYASSRAAGPFVRVHCAALPDHLIESELFGHVKGAFTGAVVDRKGRFELADGGTILLDEIGEIPLPLQAKLLRVLQEREFERVGGMKTIKVNVRIIVATHRDLPKMVEQRLFREDLYYRLNVFPIYIPPLAKRKSDIILLAEHFMARYAEQNGKKMTKLSSDAIELLMRHTWPGNVRELENCIERAVLLSDGEVIRATALPPSIQLLGRTGGPSQALVPALAEGASLRELVGAYEKAVLDEALKLNNGNLAATARQLGSTPRIIGYKAKHYGLSAD